MIIEIWENAGCCYLRSIKEVKLTKKIKNEIKEKLIESLIYKDLSSICKIRGSKIEKMNHKKQEKYLNNNYLKESDITFLNVQ